MGQISLEGMEFFANHGYYDEEQKIGNRYGVDLAIRLDFKGASDTDNLELTVNYETLYQIVQEQMKIPARLLEHLAHRILGNIFDEFPQIKYAEISISKFNPPLGGLCNKAKITLVEERQSRQF